MSRADLQRRVLAFVASDGGSEDFEALALALHRFQHAGDAVVRALCPEPAASLAAIPAVPVGLFREVPVGTVGADEPHVAFHTSGTTTGRPGVHRMRDTVTYDAGCMAWAKRFLPSTKHTLAMVTDAPTSSLGHMVRGFAPFTGPVRTATPELVLQTDEPVFLCTTAFALDAWLQTEPPALPAGSAILTTGGFKGREHERDAERLVSDASKLAPVLLEYGMTELSSQLWAQAGEPYAAPPWLRVQPVDPVSGAPVPHGEVGQLRFVDLCNLDSTVHVETLDQGRLLPDGRLELLGRLPDAPLRGCSLTDEDLLA